MKTKTIIEFLIIAGIVFLALYYLAPTYTPITSAPPKITDAMLSCQTNADCQVVATECCNNNVPGQKTCINEAQVASWKQKLNGYCTNKPIICSMLSVAGNYSCTCENNICTTNFNNLGNITKYTGIYKG